MQEFLIDGGYPLSGVVDISGAKNSALHIIAATLLTDQSVVINKVPNLDDIWSMEGSA